MDPRLAVTARNAKPRGKRRAKITPRGTEPRLLPLSVLTVGMLIALLEDNDPDAPVVIEGHCGGFEWVGRTSRVPPRLDVNRLEGSVRLSTSSLLVGLNVALAARGATNVTRQFHRLDRRSGLDDLDL